jgi:metal-dependent amidase/aminoacylase/carboxypeptidase family protein
MSSPLPQPPLPAVAPGRDGGLGQDICWWQLGLEGDLEGLLPELIQLRRHLHRHPELSGHEQQTAALVAGELRRWGWEVREGVGRTGVLAELGPRHLEDGRPAPLVGLRVDMDALPVEERTGLDYASTVQGLMHACGHDLHTGVGLGVAAVLARLDQRRPELLRARVRLLFQPAEETAEGAAWTPCSVCMCSPRFLWARWGCAAAA